MELKREYFDKRIDQVMEHLLSTEEQLRLLDRSCKLKGVERLLTLKDVGFMVGLSERSIEREVKEGRLRSVNIRQKPRFKVEWVKEWLEAHTKRGDKETKSSNQELAIKTNQTK